MKIKLNALFALLLLTMACSVAQTDGDTRLARKIDEYLVAYEQVGFSGSILVAEDGKITLYKGYGYANDSSLSKVDQSTIWTIGSITKPLTSAAILKLEMLGTLKVEEKLKKYIPELINEYDEVTIHHLLTHTAGFPEYSGRDNQKRTKAEFIAFLNATGLRSKPGDQFYYSNAGFTMLGILIERTAGQPYEEFLKEHLLDPADMLNTGYVLPDWSKNDFAIGYNSKNEAWGTVYDRNTYEDGVSWNLKANGGILSTPEDMFKWHMALQGESILSFEMIEKMYGKHVQTPKDFSPFNDKSPGYYGYGWGMTESSNFKPIIMHGGSNDIFEAGYMYYPESQIFFFITSNRVRKNAVPAILDIDKIISKKKYKLPEPQIIPDKETINQYLGEYVFEDGSKFSIEQSTRRAEEGNLVIRPMDKKAFLRIVGEPVDSKKTGELKNYVNGIMDASREGKPFSPYVKSADPDKVNQMNADDKHEEVTIGGDDRSVFEIQSDFWAANLDEKGAYVSSNFWGAVQVHDRTWVLTEVQFEGGRTFIDHTIGEGELKRISTNYRPFGLSLRPKSPSKFVEVNNRAPYEFSIQRSSRQIKVTTVLHKVKYTATKILDK